ncbi:hypothetical protein [Aquimarina aquimarini]|uniref:hypothetical protein n=1 Tax=Aquimarina aquimarini TaxID=1191734 RepID=UPI000D55F7A7|nr:hypothetical protein [Aquimarina aquimarini]
MYQVVTRIVIIFSLIFSSISNAQESKNTLENSDSSISDVFKVGYTYWWPQSGPFIGNCGDTYSFVFLGTVRYINTPAEDSTSIVVSQKGGIQIDEVLTVRDVKNNTYKNQSLFVSDCFYDQDLTQGDKVLVFCYEYEGDYSIPGKKSILKISDSNDLIVQSIKSYIEKNQNPLSLKKDISLWKKYGLDTELKQLISCKEAMD